MYVRTHATTSMLVCMYIRVCIYFAHILQLFCCGIFSKTPNNNNMSVLLLLLLAFASRNVVVYAKRQQQRRRR